MPTGMFAPGRDRGFARLLRACGLSLLLLTGSAAAQDVAPPALPPQDKAVDPAVLDALKVAVDTDQTLTDDARTQALSSIEDARADLVQEQKWNERRRALRATLDGADAELDRIRDLLGRPQGQADVAGSLFTLFTPLGQLETALETKRQEKRVQTEGLERLQQEDEQLDSRRTDAPKALAAARDEQSEVEDLLAALPAADEPAAGGETHRLRQRARLQRVRAQIAALELEQSSFDSVAQLLQARIDERRHRTAAIDARIQQLQEVAADKRREAIDRAERAAAAALSAASAEARPLAQENVDLVKARRDLLEERERVARLRDEVEQRRGDLQADFDAARKREALVGLTETIGLELRQLRRTQLEHVESIRRGTRALRRDQVRAFEARFRHEDEQRELRDLDAAVAAVLESAPPPQDRHDAVAAEIRTLLEERRPFLQVLIDGYDQLTSDYAQIDTEAKLFMEEAETCTTFVDERVLWISSTRPIWESVASDNMVEVRRLLRAGQGGVEAVIRSARQRPGGVVAALVAGISVGLGFGLQEIFANFVSGLILLFERPIRVGDLVTVGTIDGRVTRIQMRATTITDFDRKELVVPNREFVTRQFVNWSLSNSTTRITVKVGVAYGTDTRQAQRILVEAAGSCRHVLRDPAPNTVFRGFGDSTLDLELRVFIPSMDDWIETMNEVHHAVDEAFKEAGIEIAFPQRDLHLRSTRGLPGTFPSLEPRPQPPTDPTADD